MHSLIAIKIKHTHLIIVSSFNTIYACLSSYIFIFSTSILF